MNQPSLTPPAPGFDELSAAVRGRHLHRLARRALQAYDVESTSVRLAREGYCTTFRVQLSDGSAIALKASRHQTDTWANLCSEARWAVHLHASGAPVVPLVHTSTGDLATVASEPLAGTRGFVAYQWFPGRRHWAGLSSRSAIALGRLIALTHEAGRSFDTSSFERKTWTVDMMCGKWSGPDSLLGRVPGSVTELVGDWHDRIGRVYLDVPHTAQHWGAILADVGLHNVVWHDGTPTLFDFNDAGWGLYAYDLALLWREVTDLSDRGDDLLEGYRQITDLPSGWGVEMRAAAIIRLLRWRATRDAERTQRLIGRLRSLSLD